MQLFTLSSHSTHTRAAQDTIAENARNEFRAIWKANQGAPHISKVEATKVISSSFASMGSMALESPDLPEGLLGPLVPCLTDTTLQPLGQADKKHFLHRAEPRKRVLQWGPATFPFMQLIDSIQVSGRLVAHKMQY